MHLVYKILQHFFSNGEIRYDAIFQRSDSGNVTGRAAQHAFCLSADRNYGFRIYGVTVVTDRNH